MTMITRTNFTEAIAAYTERLRADSRSPHTVSCYVRDLQLVASVLGPIAITDISPANLDSALADGRITCKADGTPRAASTINRLRASLRSFTSWLVDTDQLTEDPARSIKTARTHAAPPDYLSDAEVRNLLKTVRQSNAPEARRDRLIIELFLGTGIRLAELTGLNVDDVDLVRKKIRITGKGGRPQDRFLNTGLRVLLRPYIAERSRSVTVDEPALFVSSRGTRLCDRQVARRVDHWLKASQIQKHLGPHGLRHTFATRLYRTGGDLLVVQRALGHASVATTQIYTHLCDSQLEEAMESM
jgi:integrase/recombinase XerC